MREIASSLIALSNDNEPQNPPHKCGARGACGAELHDRSTKSCFCRKTILAKTTSGSAGVSPLREPDSSGGVVVNTLPAELSFRRGFSRLKAMHALTASFSSTVLRRRPMLTSHVMSVVIYSIPIDYTFDVRRSARHTKVVITCYLFSPRTSTILC